MPRNHKGRIPLGWSLLFLLVISLPSLTFPAHAAASPDLTVDSIWLEDPSQPGQPVSQVSPGQSFLIVATIKNIGQVTASGYYVDVYYDSDYGRGGPDNITAGEVQTWYVGPLTAQAGTHTTKWVADPDNQIAELDETNNQKEYTFTVGSQTTTTTTSTTSSSSTSNSETQTTTATTSSTTSSALISTTSLASNSASTTGSTSYLTATQTVGSASLHSGDLSTAIRAETFTPSVSMTVTAVGLGVYTAVGNAYVGIYDDISGSPNNLLGSSASTALSSGWNDIALTTPIYLISGTQYWLALQVSSSSASLYYATSGSYKYRWWTYGAFTNPFGPPSGTGNNLSFNMRVTYTQTTTATSITSTSTVTSTPQTSASTTTSSTTSSTLSSTTSSTSTTSSPVTVSIIVTANPVGSIDVDGTTYTSPQTFAWVPGSSHTIAASSPVPAAQGTQYVWTSWTDGGPQSRTIAVPSSSTTYTANYQAQYQVTYSQTGCSLSVSLPATQWVNAGGSASGTFPSRLVSGDSKTQCVLQSSPNVGPISAPTQLAATYKTQYQLTMQVDPSGGAATSPGVGGWWYDAGQTVSIQASPASGYVFHSWGGSGSGSYTGTANPASVTMNGPVSEAATLASSTIATGSIVSVSDSPDPVARHRTVYFSVTIKNTGNTAWSGASISIKIYRPDGTLVASPAVTVGGIQPGGQSSYTIGWRVPYNAPTGIWHYQVYVNNAGILIASSTDPANTITVR